MLQDGQVEGRRGAPRQDAAPPVHHRARVMSVLRENPQTQVGAGRSHQENSWIVLQK